MHSLTPDQFAQDAEALAATAYEVVADLSAAEKSSHQVAAAARIGGNVFQLEKYPIALAMNFGDFSRQHNQLHMKAFIDPGAYEHILARRGQAGADRGIPGDRLWLYKTRYWLNLGIHAAGHPSVARCFIAR